VLVGETAGKSRATAAAEFFEPANMSTRKEDRRRAASAKRLSAPTTKRVSPVVRQLTSRRSTTVALGNDARFDEVVALIEAARGRAYEAVNSELVALYWQLGEYISKKIATAQWGDGVVEDLATALARRFPGLRGFARANLFRMDPSSIVGFVRQTRPTRDPRA
jgi:hypothetical protein